MNVARATPRQPAFDEADLRRLAGRGSFQRGLLLLADGHVTKLEISSGRVRATVEGMDVYRVELAGNGKELAYTCTCEDSADGSFCEHMAAAGLAGLAGAGATTPPKPPRPAVTKEDVRKHLLGLDNAALVDLLMDRAEWDPQLRDRLFIETAKGRSAGELDVRALKESLDQTIGIDDYIDWRGASAYAMGVEHAVDALDELFDKGHDAELLEVVEYAMKRVERAAGQVQDDGDMGVIFDRLHELHFNLCQRARPDPVALARRLFEWEVTSPMSLFHDCATKYADIFGEKGIAEYKRLAELAWKNVPSLGPGQKDIRDCRRFDLTSLLTRLVDKDGVEAVVELLKKDLSAPHSFLRIAETYRKAGDGALAARWAEKGVAAFPKSLDRRLREFLAEEYQLAGRGEEALALSWTEFVERPSLGGYEALKKRADANACWPEWKKKAREHLEKIHAPEICSASTPRDRALLVQVYLLESDVEAALREARTGGCGEGEWMQLASALEKKRPAEAASIYAARLDTVLVHADNDRYRHVVRQMQKIKALFEEAGQAKSFVLVLEDVKRKHGRKMNLMRLIETARW